MVVRLTVLMAHIAPIASGVTFDELDGRLTGLLECSEGTGRDDNTAERKLRLRFGDHWRSFRFRERQVTRCPSSGAKPCRRSTRHRQGELARTSAKTVGEQKALG